MLSKFTLDLWTLWGLTAQGFFFLRFVIQWLDSEKNKKTTVPLSFWYLSLVGSGMLFVYAIARGDIVFFLAAILQIFLYYRNLKIAQNEK